MLQLFEMSIVAGLPVSWVEMDARAVDAILVLHKEYRKEVVG
jgi:hypothetical protein